MSEQPKASAPSASGERPCPECKEMVRPGLVRCWNCGAFMNRSLEEKYLELQAAPKKIFFSPLPADADIHAVGAELVEDEEEDDFVLAPQGFVPHGHSGAAPAQKAEGNADGAAGVESKSWSGPTGEAPPGKSLTGPPEPAVSHSVATGGDALLDIAMREIAEESRKRKKTRRATGGARTANGFIIFCPYGCKIEVRDQHRGMTGKCPKCRAPFLVPIDPPDYAAAKDKAAEAEGAAVASKAPGGFVVWLKDLHVHTVNPVKLKLKADSLIKEFVEKDFGFSPERLLVAGLGKKAGGLFGGGDKKKPDPRDAMLAHLRESKPIEELPVAEKHVFTPDQVRQLRVVQPASSRMDSMFHGILVFGAHQIAVQLPVAEGDPQFVSFGLMRFREFARALAANYGMERFGADLGIPLQDEYTSYKCHYTETQIKALKNDEWYKADPTSKVVLAGWKCAGCGLVVSEDARKKEKLGGANGKAIAKAICPKCKKKFGEQPLYTLPDAASAPSMAAETPASSPATTP
jgi:hypothetical protein